MRRPIQWMVLLGVGYGLLFWGPAACRTVPETGRSQLSLVSAEQESQLGESAFQEIKKEETISEDAEANALVEKVGKRIAAVAHLPNAQWEFVVFESEQANAFCLPGGKIGVYTGILPITQDEAGLATVLGHEVAHAVARHGAERMSESLLLQTGGSMLGTSLSELNPETQQLVLTAYGLGATVGRQLPHSRKQEAEADHIGLLYMARAGYDPDQAVEFWQRFAQYTDKAGGGGTPWFLRTHPLTEDRIANIKSMLPEARREYQAAPPAE